VPAEVDWPGPGAARSIAEWVTYEPWVWPACEALHFVGLCLLFTSVLLVDLRTLGLAKSIPIATVYHYADRHAGLINLTGMLFFIAAPQQYVENVTFFWKFSSWCSLPSTTYFMLSEKTWGIGRESTRRSSPKPAGSGIFLWLGVLFCGHMLPFIGNAF
jgi:hypothetical protein